MKTRYDELIARVRTAAAPERAAPVGLRGYLEKVRLHAHKVTDLDVDELKLRPSARTRSSSTPSPAVTAGLERLDAGLGTLS